MKLVLRSFASLLLVAALATTAYAQNYPFSAAGAVYNGTYTVPVGNNDGTIWGQQKEEASGWGYISMRTAQGTTSLQVDAQSVSFQPGAEPEKHTAVEIFNSVARVSVLHSISQGVIAMPAAGTSIKVDVYTAGLVVRSGTGASTYFTQSGSNGSIRTVTVARPSNGGSPVATVTSWSGPAADGNAEATCPQTQTFSTVGFN